MAKIDRYLVQLLNVDDAPESIPGVVSAKEIPKGKAVPGFGVPEGDDRWFEVDVKGGTDVTSAMVAEEIFGAACNKDEQHCESVYEDERGHVRREDMALFELFLMSPEERRKYENR